jgi:hypothetical protein
MIYQQAVFLCHSESFDICHPECNEGSCFLSQGKLPEACPEHSEGTHEILHFVQDDTLCQILRLTPQNDITIHFQ